MTSAATSPSSAAGVAIAGTACQPKCNGTVMGLTDPHVAKDFREGLRKSTCARFHTVLGPGSDGYHEDHVHVDLAERRSGYRMCQWDVREPGEEIAHAPDVVAHVPLPRPRPTASAEH